MSIHATGNFEFKSWDENTWDGKPWNEESGAKLTRASVTNAFHGEVEGEGTLQYLMTYHDDNSGSFVGLERLVGRVGSRSGSFVLLHNGTFEGDMVKATWSVIPGSGTGELSGLRGEGGFVARHGQQQTPFTLDYDFE